MSAGGGEAPAADPVRAQYEALPYPARDPEDERRRLITGSPSHLDEINHYCRAGRLDFARPFRALVAGGGTGDGLIMLAEQLSRRQVPAELTYLDLSAASRAVAEQRAAVRGLGSIRFVTGSLLDVERLAPGPYDYIDCCGVLHHLPDPAAGLRALTRVLAPDGGMGMMLYGSLGRIGVYPVQASLRALAGSAPNGEKLALARRLLADLPESNWLRRNPFVGDHLAGDDAGLYDLLLHSCDRAYTVPEVTALLHGAGLAPTAFIEPIRYDPATWLTDPELLARARSLPWLDAAGLAEALAGSLKTHVFYAVPATRAGAAVARPDGPHAVPLIREGGAGPLAAALRAGRLKITMEGRPLRLDVPAGAAELTAMVDGRRSLDDLRQALGLDWFAFKARFDRVYALLNALNLMLLRF